MPRVSADYSPVPSVKPRSPREPLERLDIPFPHVTISDAVGKALENVGQGYGTLGRATEHVANALDGLGKSLDQTGDKLWNRAVGLQNLQNENQLTKAITEFHDYADTKTAQFQNLQGEGANEGTYKAYLADLKNQQQMLSQKLNPTVQGQFDRHISSTIGERGLHAATHVASETRKVTVSTSEARINQIKGDITKSTDPKTTADGINQLQRQVFGTQAPAMGWSSAKAMDAFKQHLAEAYSGQFQEIARTDPDTALKMLEENKEIFPGDKYVSLKTHLMEAQDRQQSDAIANKVQTADPDGDLETKIEKAKREAREVNPGAPMLEKHAADAVRVKHGLHNQEVREELKRNWDSATEALEGRANPAGKAPKTMDEYNANGEQYRQAYNRLSEVQKSKFQRLLNRNAKGDYSPTDITEARYDSLWGMAQRDPHRFVDQDINMEEIPRNQREQLKAEQRKIVKGGMKLEDDPRVKEGLSYVRTAGVLERNLKPGSANWDHFLGAFRNDVYGAQRAKGFEKKLTPDEYITIAKEVQNKVTGTGWFGTNVGMQRQYELERTIDKVPKEIVDRYRNIDSNITDDEIIQGYFRAQHQLEWKKRFSK